MTLLKGRVILDCSTLLPGPYIGKLLAEKGARVLKIENPDRPDPTRQMAKGYYEDLNERKELVWLNLTRDEDRARFRELLANADGLIEGFRPAAKKKLGLDEASLHVVNPRLCIASLVGYPEDGPWRDRAGHDMNFQAVTGALSLFRELPALPLADLFSAYEAALSMAAALDSVARGGKGTRVVVSMSETMKSVQSLWIRNYRETGNLQKPGTTLMSELFPCYRIYVAGDGRRVAVGAVEEKFWQKVCDILGVPEYSDAGMATGERGARAIEAVSKAFASKPWAHWASLFDAADCCVEPVLDYSEVFSRGV